MFPVLIIWFLRRHRKKQKKNRPSALHSKEIKIASPSFLCSLWLIIFLSVTTKSISQNKALNYQILRNGSKVGTLRFSETTSAGMDYLKMESDVKTRFIFTFTAHASEEAVYYNGVLLRSSIYRQLNGNEKANKQHQADNRQYIIHKGKSSGITKIFPITYNMLSLYSKEPENIAKVYSDNFETFITIQKSGPHTYKVTLPDGNYNYYYYKNGLLTQVDVHHSLYSANIILMN